jgi:hypothetical protein
MRKIDPHIILVRSWKPSIFEANIIHAFTKLQKSLQTLITTNNFIECITYILKFLHRMQRRYETNRTRTICHRVTRTRIIAGDQVEAIERAFPGAACLALAEVAAGGPSLAGRPVGVLGRFGPGDNGWKHKLLDQGALYYRKTTQDKNNADGT